MSTEDTNTTASAGPLSSEELGLLKEWADAAGVTFVSRSSGQRTIDTVSKDDLLQLMRAVRAAERERFAAIAAPERFVYSDEEWRVRCEVRDSILEA